MVNFATTILSLLAAASCTGAIPSSLEARAPDCLDNLNFNRGLSSDAAKCINELAALNSNCVASASGTVFRKCGNTVITGQSAIPPSTSPSTSSPCKDVARGAGKIMDACSRGDGTVLGRAPAFGNGNLVITIRGPA